MRIVEHEGFELDVYREVYLGTLDVAVMRDVVPAATARSLAAAFRQVGKHERPAPAVGLEAGVHHYGKTLTEYFEQVDEERRGAVGAFDCRLAAFGEFLAVMARMWSDIGVVFRPASHEGKEASPFVVRAWQDHGEFSLRPHDDLAQLDDVKQRGFEIQRISESRLVATNVYLEVQDGGELEVWNEASAELRASRPFVGFPYDPEHLAGRRTIDVRPGDVVALYGGLVHGVRRASRRVVASFFSGHLNARTIVYWS